MNRNETYCTGSGNFCGLNLTGAQIESVCHPGANDWDVEYLMGLNEVKTQLDAISDEELAKWWDDYFCDDTPEKHAAATRETRLSYLVWDCCWNEFDN